MARFRSRRPSVRLVFTSGFFSDCAPKLLSDKLDISLVMTSRYQHEEPSALVEEPLFEVDHGIVAAPGHPVFEAGRPQENPRSGSCPNGGLQEDMKRLPCLSHASRRSPRAPR